MLHSCKMVTAGTPECTLLRETQSLENREDVCTLCTESEAEGGTRTHELTCVTQTHTHWSRLQTANSGFLPDTAAPGGPEDRSPGMHSIVSGWGGMEKGREGGGGVGGDPGLPLPRRLLILSSSYQRSPHEKNDAWQRPATSNDSQHESVCQERCRLSSMNFTKACL